MPRPQLLYGAYDKRPSDYGLDIISYAQREMEWGVKYVGNNPTRTDFYGIDFDYAIVGGPSAVENSFDNVLLVVGKVRKKPVYVLGDSPGSVLRPGVKQYVDQAIAIVAVPSDTQHAKAFGYKDAVWLGYPPRWNNPVTVKPCMLAQERYHLGPRVFVCGIEHAQITDNMLAAVLAGMEARGGYWRVYFKPHSSEISATQDQDRRAKLLAHPRVSKLRTWENIASIMMTMSLTVCTRGAPALLDGALLRLPVVYYEDNMVMEYMKERPNEDIWDPVVAGVCEPALSDTMPFMLKRLLDPGKIGGSVRKHLRWRQEAAFPQQLAGMNTVAEIMTYIENPASYVPFHERAKC